MTIISKQMAQNPINLEKYSGFWLTKFVLGEKNQLIAFNQQIKHKRLFFREKKMLRLYYLIFFYLDIYVCFLCHLSQILKLFNFMVISTGGWEAALKFNRIHNITPQQILPLIKELDTTPPELHLWV